MTSSKEKIALGSTEELTDLQNNKKVVVIGAGTSGLAATYTLLNQEASIDVKALESAGHAGGRMAGDEVDGFYIDTGATLFIESYKTAKRLADQLGIVLKKISKTKSGLIYRNGKFYPAYVGGTLWQKLRTAQTLLTFRLLSLKALFQMFRFTKLLKAKSNSLKIEDYSGVIDIDTKENFEEFMHRNSMSEYLLQASENDICCFLCGYPKDIGVSYALTLLWHYTFNPSEHVVVPEKGVGSFSTALVKACEKNTVLSTPVKKVSVKDGAVNGVILENEEFIEADAVICAVSATAALRILPDLEPNEKSILSKINYSSCCNIVFGIEGALFPEDIYAATFPRGSSSLLTVIADLKFMASKVAPEGKHVLHALVIGEQARKLFELDDSDIEEQVIEEIRKFFPAMPKKPEFIRIYRWHEALCLAHGGMLKEMNQIQQHGLKGIEGLFLAGDYTHFPISNGALRSGVNSAQKCVSYLSKR